MSATLTARGSVQWLIRHAAPQQRHQQPPAGLQSLCSRTGHAEGGNSCFAAAPALALQLPLHYCGPHSPPRSSPQSCRQVWGLVWGPAQSHTTTYSQGANVRMVANLHCGCVAHVTSGNAAAACGSCVRQCQAPQPADCAGESPVRWRLTVTAE